MGWSIGYDEQWKRDIGYGVPAYCDHPGCTKKIDRGLSYVCGGDPHGGEYGCGLFFCGKHLFPSMRRPQRCQRCKSNRPAFPPKPDHPTWIKHKLTDESWSQWRAENVEEVNRMKQSMAKVKKPKNKPEPVEFVNCEHCGNEQADMGKNVLCENCDEAIS